VLRRKYLIEDPVAWKRARFASPNTGDAASDRSLNERGADGGKPWRLLVMIHVQSPGQISRKKRARKRCENIEGIRSE
jgi:hypothetical protein